MRASLSQPARMRRALKPKINGSAAGHSLEQPHQRTPADPSLLIARPLQVSHLPSPPIPRPAPHEQAPQHHDGRDRHVRQQVGPIVGVVGEERQGVSFGRRFRQIALFERSQSVEHLLDHGRHRSDVSPLQLFPEPPLPRAEAERPETAISPISDIIPYNDVRNDERLTL